MRKLLRTYGPTFRWVRFRLYHDSPTDRFIPLRITQVIGGKNWSPSITRTEPVQIENES